MENTLLDAVWLNEGGSCSIVHLQEVSGLDQAELQVLIDSGALSPLSGKGGNPAFSSDAMIVARTARRLRDDFALEPNGLALAMQLLARVESLERELERLRASIARPPSIR
jgi:chaperone modulatory protein CbpM